MDWVWSCPHPPPILLPPFCGTFFLFCSSALKKPYILHSGYTIVSPPSQVSSLWDFPALFPVISFLPSDALSFRLGPKNLLLSSPPMEPRVLPLLPFSPPKSSSDLFSQLGDEEDVFIQMDSSIPPTHGRIFSNGHEFSDPPLSFTLYASSFPFSSSLEVFQYFLFHV